MMRTLTTCLALCVTVLAVYWHALWLGFVDFDDPEYARDNLMVHQGLTSRSIEWALTTNMIANWHPLTWMSLMLDAHMWGRGPHPNPMGFHVTNVLLHGANVVLVFLLLRRMTGAHWRSALAAGMFAVHPMHVESVAWIAERKDVLSTFFGLAAIWAYLTYVQWPGLREYVVMAALFALSLFSKAMLVTLPFVLLLLDFWPLKRRGWAPQAIDRRPEDPSEVRHRNSVSLSRLIVEKLPLLGIGLAASTITYMVQRGSHAVQEGEWLPMWLSAENAFVSYGRYLGKLLWPADLAVLYPHPSLVSRGTWPVWAVAGSMALLLAITVLAVAQRRRRPYFIVGWLWFLGTLVPVIGFVQIGRQAMADRYAYVPFIGLYIVIAWTAGAIAARARRMATSVATSMGAALIALGVTASHQITYWSDSITLFSHAIDVTKDNWMMHNNLGGVYNLRAITAEKNGDRRTGTELRAKALAEIETAMAIYPNVAWLHNHHGMVLGLTDRLFEAQKDFEKAVELDPTGHEYVSNLGLVLQRRGRIDDAIEHYRKAIALQPTYSDAHRNLAIAFAELKQYDNAIKELEVARRLNPDAAVDYDPLITQFRARATP